MNISDNKYKLYLRCIIIVIIFKSPVFLMGLYKPSIPWGDAYLHLLIGYYPFGWHSFTGTFPIGCTIIYKLFNYNISIYHIAMFTYSSVAFALPLFIINYYTYNISKINKLILNIVLLLFVSSIGVTSWDISIGSDSLTLSSLVISLSMLYLCYINRGSTSVKIIFILSTIYLILVRDSNYIIVVYIMIFVFFCQHLSVRFKMLSLILISISIGLVSISAAKFRAHIHLRDILAYYILENDSAVESNKQYYEWYMNNTKMPDIKQEYLDCNLSVLAQRDPLQNGLPHYPFNGEYPNEVSPNKANYISTFLTGETCLPFQNQKFNEYFYSSDSHKDYLRFLIAHPKFIFFASGKYLPLTRFMIFSPSKVTSFPPYTIISKIAYNHKIVFYILLHLFYLLLQIIIWKELLFSRNKIKIIWILGVFIPSWLFTWLCFIAEPIELVRHLLAGEWYMIIGGLYLVLFEKYDQGLKT